jgi:hypothetical protein
MILANQKFTHLTPANTDSPFKLPASLLKQKKPSRQPAFKILESLLIQRLKRGRFQRPLLHIKVLDGDAPDT